MEQNNKQRQKQGMTAKQQINTPETEVGFVKNICCCGTKTVNTLE